jgi:metal-responsive CopG/Arc/MetJ family transcriptional regulator
MATRKITFTLPEELAQQFMRSVAPRERSRYVAQALRAKLSRDRSLRRACIIANNNPDVQAIERGFDTI